MIIDDRHRLTTREQPSELSVVARFLERLLNRETPEVKPEITVQPQITVQPAANNAQPVRKWRCDFERDRYGLTRTVIITAIE